MHVTFIPPKDSRANHAPTSGSGSPLVLCRVSAGWSKPFGPLRRRRGLAGRKVMIIYDGTAGATQTGETASVSSPSAFCRGRGRKTKRSEQGPIAMNH